MAVSNKGQETSPLSKFMGLVANGDWGAIFPEEFWDESQRLMDHARKYPAVIYNEPPLDLILKDNGALYRAHSNNDIYIDFYSYSRGNAFSINIGGVWGEHEIMELEFDWEPELGILELAIRKSTDPFFEYMDKGSNGDDDLRSLLEWGLARIADWLVIQVAARDY